MKSLAFLPLRSARLILPGAALLAVLGGTAAAAAPGHPALAHAAPARPGRAPRLAGLTWHKLTLQNGWKSASAATLVSGVPA